ncbi:MAG: glycosyltransferase, partial [Gammaproteobacteria bacterium]
MNSKSNKKKIALVIGWGSVKCAAALGVLRVLRRENIDVLFTPHTKFPLRGPPSVVTVHGLEWHHCPADYRMVERIKQWAWFRLASRRSAGMVTFATNTKRDILAMAPRSSIPICVVPEGVDAMFKRLEASQIDGTVGQRLGINHPFVLSVCSLEPRKNVDRLIRSYASVVASRD